MANHYTVKIQGIEAFKDTFVVEIILDHLEVVKLMLVF